MKLLDLFEYDPKVGAALGTAAQGIGQAADSLKGPIPLTAKLQDMETMLNDLNSKLNKALNDNPDLAIAPFFADWAEGVAKKAGIKIIVNGIKNLKFWSNVKEIDIQYKLVIK